MRDFAIVIGLIMLGVITYLFVKQSKAKANKVNVPTIPAVEPTEPTDSTIRENKVVEQVNQLITAYQLPPYTCIVYDGFGRGFRVTSPTNSLWFQQLCNGQIAYPYQNYLFYSPNYWNRWYGGHYRFRPGGGGWYGGGHGHGRMRVGGRGGR